MAKNDNKSAHDPAATDATSENSRNSRHKRRNGAPAAVVGLGASAGGVGVLQQFFADMPTNTNLAFVVVMHLSPEHESVLAEVIQQKTRMQVKQVDRPVKVQPNHVYVIPPNHQLTFEDSTLHLIEPQHALGKRVTIDLFFRSLAQAYGQRAVGIILSGSDSDGVIGLKHVRAQGGLTIAQDPGEAEHNSMPLNAIATGMVDWVLPVAKMTPKLLEFVANEQRMQLPPEIPEADMPDAKVKDAPGGETVSIETRAPEDESALGDVLVYLRVQTGNDFSHYKRATVLRRIARRLQVNSLETIPQYIEFLRTHPAESRALLQDLLIGVTHFFRDREAFASLEAHIPDLLSGKQADDQIRVWVAGCATGEEAYSIGILLSEYCERLDNPPAIQIFATDVDEQAIADAREGIYPAMIETDISPERLRAFFSKHQGRYRVRKELREKILFATHNVLRDAPFSRMDLISCRNLMIYLNPSAQGQIFDIFHFSLRASGLLFLGGSENHGQAQSLFSPVDAKQRLFVRRSTPRPAWRVPLLSMRAPEIAPRRLVVSNRRKLPLINPDEMDKASARPPMPGHLRRELLFGELHLRLLEEYGPPSMVVNDNHDIVHLSESAGRYLSFGAGEPSANVVKAIHPALQTELRTALYKAAQRKEAVSGSLINVGQDGTSELIRLEVRPMRATDEAHGFYLILFQQDTATAAPLAAPESISEQTNDEIQYLKEQLASSVEQYDASGEELKASNEELQAMNEEMRSATEELETSKEELQSVNEELITVNHELKSSVEELSRTNADLNNLMASTDIGTIFLDRQLRIHRFTPAAQEVFNLLPADLGRPISDITTRLNYEGFLPDLEQVLQKLLPIEREVQLGKGDWFLTRIAPYRTGEDYIAGVVATFINITRRKKAEEQLRALSEELKSQVQRFNSIMASVPDFVYQFDLEGRFTYISQSLLDLWRLSYDQAIGKNFHELSYPPELAGKLQKQIAEVIETRRPLRDETPYTSAIGTRMYEYLFFPLLGPNGRVEGVGGVTRDITERKQTEQLARENEERFRTVADNVPQLIWTNDAKGAANYFNQRWFEYTGLTFEESLGAGRKEIIHPDDRPGALERWEQSLRDGLVFDCEYRLRSADGKYRWFLGRNVPLRAANGAVVSWFGAATDIQDRKQVEAALLESEERYQLLVEGTPDYAMFLISPENQIVYWSSGAEKVFGWSAEEAIGQRGELIFTPEDRAKGEVEKEINTALERGSAPDRRWHLRKDGTRLWVDGVMRRLDTEDGSLRGFAKIARDASEQKDADDALHYARDQMEQRVLERTADLVAMNNELEQAMKQREELERELLEISERERRRIGQDLHDVVCQELTATALFLKSAGNRMDNAQAAKSLNEAAGIVNRNVAIARDLARSFQPTEMTSGGVLDALRGLCKQANAVAGLHCELKLPKAVRLRDETIALNLYRIAQEAVRNAVSHANCTEIVICMERERDLVRLVVEDNGKGYRPRKRSKGLGVHIMEYRTHVLGGRFGIVPREGGGTKVVCEVPVKK